MSTTLLVAEHDGAQLNQSTARALTGLAPLGDVDIIVFAENGSAVCAEAAALAGVGQVLQVDSPDNSHQLAAVVAPQIAAIAAPYSVIAMPSTTFGKDLAPRAAALLGVHQVSDVMEAIDAKNFRRPIYAGNVIVHENVEAFDKVVLTMRTASFQAAVAGSDAAPIVPTETTADLPDHTRFVKLEAQASERPDLQGAAWVVAGGRGVGSEENFAVIYDLADKLGAGCGASRAAVDAGYCPNDMQVGQTGKIIAPDVYIALGISGAIQHITGIKDAGTIIAVNKDEEAPIFDVADIGIVGDLFDLAPRIGAALGK
ncbi:MAG: electron transfer flavoprotein subunit alpha/FixB family protein [Gammaproteobacteria bacterium]|nr:electron transfer flavoprotein subunit alpha/FixB family protein [Gammaproteobacteria bacterium]